MPTACRASRTSAPVPPSRCEATVKALNTRYGRSENTGTSNLTDITVKKGSSIDEVTSQLPKNVDLTYSDGSTGSLPISSWNTEGIDHDEGG